VGINVAIICRQYEVLWPAKEEMKALERAAVLTDESKVHAKNVNEF
jgi:hypothetical protein